MEIERAALDEGERWSEVCLAGETSWAMQSCREAVEPEKGQALSMRSPGGERGDYWQVGE